MPKLYIEIPEDIRFVDSKTKEPIQGDDGSMSFEDLIHKVMDNPKWNQSYKLIKAADAIMKAFEEASDGIMILADTDHKELKEAIENPKVLIITAVHGAQTQPGFGIHPRLSRQMLPLLDPIINATENDPLAEVEKDVPSKPTEVAKEEAAA